MSAQPTPGPWMAHGPAKPTSDAPEGGDYCINDGGTNVIAEAFFRVSEGAGGTRNAKANALLMAAAPELLAVLLKLRRGDLHQRVRPLWDEAQAAIAKANGHTS